MACRGILRSADQDVVFVFYLYRSLQLLILDRERAKERVERSSSAGSYISYPSYIVPKFHINYIALPSAGA